LERRLIPNKYTQLGYNTLLIEPHLTWPSGFYFISQSLWVRTVPWVSKFFLSQHARIGVFFFFFNFLIINFYTITLQGRDLVKVPLWLDATWSASKNGTSTTPSIHPFIHKALNTFICLLPIQVTKPWTQPMANRTKP
jgi:hypothetical protein